VVHHLLRLDQGISAYYTVEVGPDKVPIVAATVSVGNLGELRIEKVEIRAEVPERLEEKM
jgi:hypothetical protein